MTVSCRNTVRSLIQLEGDGILVSCEPLAVHQEGKIYKQIRYVIFIGFVGYYISQRVTSLLRQPIISIHAHYQTVKFFLKGKKSNLAFYGIPHRSWKFRKDTKCIFNILQVKLDCLQHIQNKFLQNRQLLLPMGTHILSHVVHIKRQKLFTRVKLSLYKRALMRTLASNLSTVITL